MFPLLFSIRPPGLFCPLQITLIIKFTNFPRPWPPKLPWLGKRHLILLFSKYKNQPRVSSDLAHCNSICFGQNPNWLFFFAFCFLKQCCQKKNTKKSRKSKKSASAFKKKLVKQFGVLCPVKTSYTVETFCPQTKVERLCTLTTLSNAT